MSSSNQLHISAENLMTGEAYMSLCWLILWADSSAPVFIFGDIGLLLFSPSLFHLDCGFLQPQQIKNNGFFFTSVHLPFPFPFQAACGGSLRVKNLVFTGLAVCGLWYPAAGLPISKTYTLPPTSQAILWYATEIFSTIILTKREIMEFGVTGKLHPCNSNRVMSAWNAARYKEKGTITREQEPFQLLFNCIVATQK